MTYLQDSSNKNYEAPEIKISYFSVCESIMLSILPVAPEDTEGGDDGF